MEGALVRNTLTITARMGYSTDNKAFDAHRLQLLLPTMCFPRVALLRNKEEIKLPRRISARLSPRAYSSFKDTAGLVDWYLKVLAARPILTKSVTAAVIYAAADASSQVITCGSLDSYNLTRTLRMGCYGLLILGPSLHYWYNLVSRIFPNQDILSTLKKIVLGQASYGPIMTAIFFSINGALQGESCSEIVGRLRRDLLTTILNGLMYWPACDFVTFRFIPLHLQPLVVNSFSYLWTIYMTYMASLEKVGAS